MTSSARLLDKVTRVARNPNLDVIRAAAILLVLVQHSVGSDNIAHRFGWTGVDLFFVLSGFLVSGLLFDELSRSGGVDAKRFLIRRGFKIYPSFWAMIGFTCVVFHLAGRVINLRALACELLFVQNYGPGLWAPTWSLAVEEHFYLGLAIAFAAATRRWGSAWTRRLPKLLVAAMAFVLVLRTTTVLLVPPRYKLVFWGTHARVDGLLFGTLLAYLYRRKALAGFVAGRRALIVAASLLLVAPACILGMESRITQTIGATLLYLGWGGILVVAISARAATDPFSRAVATIGRYSYGIYIWHEPLMFMLDRRVHFADTAAGYAVTSIAGGMMMSMLIEVPFLALRERWFPAARQPVAADAAQATA